MPPIDPTAGDPAEKLDPATQRFYLRALDILDETAVRYVVGGAYALAYHTGIVRHTKDLDIFIKRQDVALALAAFERHGFAGKRTHPHWLAKVFSADGDAFVDFIFRSGNGLCAVTDSWFDHGADGKVLGRPAPITSVEEVIFSKAFVMARERFDGADINHLLRARGRALDWQRLVGLFTHFEELLLAHLTMFRFVYPGERSTIPDSIFQLLYDRIAEKGDGPDKLCRGTLLSWDQYAIDITSWGYEDARLEPHGQMTPEEVERWTLAPK